MTFKEHLRLHGVGEGYLNPEGTLARIDVSQGVSVFLPFQHVSRVPGLTVPVSQVIFSGLSVKFTESFKTQTYADTGSSGCLAIVFSLMIFILKLVDFVCRTNIANQPPFHGYIDENTGSKDASQFPFETFLKVQAVGAQWAQYEEPDGTVWQISHIPLTDVCWVEVSD